MPQSTKSTLTEIDARLQMDVGLQLFARDSWFLVVPPADELPPPLVWTPVEGYPASHTGPLDFKGFQDEDIRNLPNYALSGAIVVPLEKADRNLRSAIVVGRSSFADVRFSSPDVSKMHATFKKKGSDNNSYWSLEDSSTNGTFANGRRLEKDRAARVFPNDEICFGGIRTVLVDIKGLRTLCKLLSTKADEFQAPECDFVGGPIQDVNKPTVRLRQPVGFML